MILYLNPRTNIISSSLKKILIVDLEIGVPTYLNLHLKTFLNKIISSLEIWGPFDSEKTQVNIKKCRLR